MSTPHGILVFGANGSGKTTLARELARILNFKHMDHEEYHFVRSEIPYTAQRSDADCLRLLLGDMHKYGGFVLSAVTGDFGEIIPRYYELGVFLWAPAQLRIKRMEQRGLDQYGERVCKGGDLYGQHVKFLEFAASRPLERIERWAQTLACPVIHVDGTKDWRTSAADIARFYEDAIAPANQAP